MKNRLASIDILRGIAVLMVLCVHSPIPTVWNLSETFFVKHVLALGSFGVDLFFVLSGFLISGLIFHEQNKTGEFGFARFWLRRAFKILPGYFVAYTVAFTLRQLGKTNITIPERLAVEYPNFIFLQNYIYPEHRWMASWSLAVEEHFYLILPALLVLLFRFKNKRIVPITVASIAVVVAVNRFFAVAGGTPLELIYIQTHFRVDALCFGVILGWFSIYRREWFSSFGAYARFAPLFVVCALLIPLVSPLGGNGTAEQFGIPVMVICFGFLVSIAANLPSAGNDSGVKFIKNTSRILTEVGFYSYGIYLAQAVMTYLPLNFLDAYFAGRFYFTGLSIPFFWIGSIFGGVVISRLIEQPFLRLRERVVPKKKQISSAQTASSRTAAA